MMTTEEIKIMLTAAEDRLAQLEPKEKELYGQFDALKKQVAELSKPMEAARDAWHLVYNETNALNVLKTFYVSELAKAEGVAA